MKIKTKLTLGVGLLFLLIILLCAVGSFNIYRLKMNIENILIANYNSLEYSRNMLKALKDKNSKIFSQFDSNLIRQENNITEIGEMEATADIRRDFNKFKLHHSDNSLESALREDIFDVMYLNMKAIQHKSDLVQTTANKSIFWIAFTGILCFCIAFFIFINLPSNIANPLKELTESIKQIASRNYSERVHFESHNELGQLAKSFNTMAQKLQEYNSSNLDKLLIENKRIEALINNMYDPVIGLDENLKVIFVNEEACKIIGMSEMELVGHFTHELASKNDLIRMLTHDITIDNSEIEAKSKPIKIFVDNKEGYYEKEIIHISIAPTGEQTKQLIGHVIILNNITEQKELDAAKTNFIAKVSHEFKTPISAIKNNLQLLENKQTGKLNELQKNLVESIKNDTTVLLKITSELLNMTEVENGNIQLSIFPTDPKEILRHAINTTKLLADQKQIKFEINCPDNISKIQADKEKTALVLTNLISNAIWYSHDNSTIYITIQQKNNQIQISVRDTGQGIAPQDIDKIFDRYFRSPGTKKEGTRIGLSLSKEFIEAQGGQITVDSEFGVGSTFTLSLNMAT